MMTTLLLNILGLYVRYAERGKRHLHGLRLDSRGVPRLTGWLVTSRGSGWLGKNGEPFGVLPASCHMSQLATRLTIGSSSFSPATRRLDYTCSDPLQLLGLKCDGVEHPIRHGFHLAAAPDVHHFRLMGEHSISRWCIQDLTLSGAAFGIFAGPGRYRGRVWGAVLPVILGMIGTV